MNKKTKSLLYLAVLFASCSAVILGLNRWVLHCEIVSGSRADYVDILGIMCSVIFITTSLLATLSNKEDTIYYENAIDYVLINPPIFNFYGLSILSYATLVSASLCVVFCCFELFAIFFVMGICFIVILFFKMTMIYFRKEKTKLILMKEFEADVKHGRVKNAEEKINHLYLNSLNAVDHRNFDICVENLSFLQNAKGYPVMEAYSIEVIKKLLVHISSNDLFYFTRIIELFQKDESFDSFLKISSIRHYVGQMLVEKVHSENDAVIRKSLYQIFVDETIRYLNELSDEKFPLIETELKHARVEGTKGISSIEEFKHMEEPDIGYYIRFFEDTYERFEEEYRLLSKVMVFYEAMDEAWFSKMNSICSMPNLLNELWKICDAIDTIDRPCRNKLLTYKHFIECYIDQSIQNQKKLTYLEYLNDCHKKNGIGSGRSKTDFFKPMNELVCQPIPSYGMHQREVITGSAVGEFDLIDYAEKGICFAIAKTEDRNVLKELLRWIWPSYFRDYSEAEPQNLYRLKYNILWIIDRMIAEGNDEGLCCVLRKIQYDITEYDYYCDPDIIQFDLLDNALIVNKLKSHCKRVPKHILPEMTELIATLCDHFINTFELEV